MVHPNHLRGINALAEEGMINNYYIISQDPAERHIGNVVVLPWELFLKKCGAENSFKPLILPAYSSLPLHFSAAALRYNR